MLLIHPNTLRLVPPLLALLALASAFVLDVIFPTPMVVPLAGRWFGVLVAVFGLLLIFWGAGVLVRAKTPIHPKAQSTVVVVGGPYRFTRNPMYLGMTLMSLGISLGVGTLMMFLAPVLFFGVINISYVPYEEEKMARSLGESYLAYERRVRRWL